MAYSRLQYFVVVGTSGTNIKLCFAERKGEKDLEKEKEMRYTVDQRFLSPNSVKS